MLSYMRKNAKSPIMKILLGGVALSFLIGFGASYFLTSMRKSGPAGQIDTVAKVAHVEISRREFIQELDRAKRRYRAQGFGQDQEMFKSPLFMRSILSNLIDMIALRLAAQDMDIKASNEEVADYLLRSGMFVSRGKFNRQTMLNYLRRSGQSLQDFEEGIRFEMGGYKLLSLLQSSVFASEDEVWKEYQAKNEKIDLQVMRIGEAQVNFDAESLSLEDIKKVYDESTEDFRKPEKRRLNYISVNVNDHIEDVDLGENDVQDYYDNNLKRYNAPEMAHYRQIILRFAGDAEKAKVREKMDSVRTQAVVEGLDFADLAGKYSEDETTAGNGGDAGWQGRKGGIQGIKDKAFALEKGDISEVIDIPGGFALIKLAGRRDAGTQPLKEIFGRVEMETTHDQARKLASKAIAATFAEITPGTDLVDFAEKKGLEPFSTPFFAKSGDAKGIEKGFEVAQSTFEMSANEIGGPHEGYSKYFIYQLAEVQESVIPAFEDIESEVRDTLATQRKEELLKVLADGYLKRLRAEEMTLEQAAEELGIDVIETGKFAASAYTVPKVGFIKGLIEGAFSVFPPDEYPAEALDNSGERIIFRIADRDIADQAAFELEKEKLQGEFMQTKYRSFVTQWIQGLRERYPVVENQEFWSLIAEND
jgi:peptidyl-prolyl cis-trans isomerase D